jgi:hypothetical protein
VIAQTLRLDDIAAEHPATYAHIVAEYARLLSLGYKFQPIRVRRDGDKFVVIDGHHRREAFLLAERTTIEAFIN